MIYKTEISGYFIDEDTANLIGQWLDKCHDDLEIELTETKKDDLTNNEKDEIISDMLNIENICEKLNVKGYR